MFLDLEKALFLFITGSLNSSFGNSQHKENGKRLRYVLLKICFSQSAALH